MKPLDLLLLAGRLIVGGVLVYAGFSKALTPAAEFAAALANYKLFPASALLPLAYAIPWVEIWTGLFLIAGLYTDAAAGLAAGLFLAFLGALGTAKLRHIDLASCGCFGAETFSPQTVIKMDAALFVVAALLVYFNRQPRGLTLDAKLN